MTAWLWGGFLALVFVLLALDLGVFHKKDEVISTRAALGWTAVWICVSLVFNVGVYFIYEAHLFGVGEAYGLSGNEAALQFLTGYVIEKSLSLDNIFVIALVFNYFRVPLQFQHRVLFWGILGALVMRGVMIGLGAALIANFQWMIYVFGAFLIFTALRMFFSKEDDYDPEKSRLVRTARRLLPISDELDGANFRTTIDGKRLFTPLFLVLLIVEGTDVIFAVDSIPAIFAVTRDPFLVFTSNIFAILGLRSLYFALASLLDKFRYLKQSLVLVLAYVGFKMIFSHSYHVPALLSLGIIMGILTIGVIASIMVAPKEPAPSSSAE